MRALNKSGSAYIYVAIILSVLSLIVGVMLYASSNQSAITALHRDNILLYEAALSGSEELCGQVNMLLYGNIRDLNRRITEQVNNKTAGSYAHIIYDGYGFYLKPSLAKEIFNSAITDTLSAKRPINVSMEIKSMYRYSVTSSLVIPGVLASGGTGIVTDVKNTDTGANLKLDATLSLQSDAAIELLPRYRWGTIPPHFSSVSNPNVGVISPVDISGSVTTTDPVYISTGNTIINPQGFIDGPVVIINTGGSLTILGDDATVLSAVIYSDGPVDIVDTVIKGVVISSSDIENNRLSYAEYNPDLIFDIEFANLQLHHRILDFLGITNFGDPGMASDDISTVLKHAQLSSDTNLYIKSTDAFLTLSNAHVR